MALAGAAAGGILADPAPPVAPWWRWSVRSQLLTLFVGWLVLSTVVSLYQTFHAPRCPPEFPADHCLQPLFVLGEKVDLFIYLTADSRLRWWTSRGLRELQKVPLWNATALPFGEGAGSSAVLPLSWELLHGVRRNESLLHAHCFLVRAGTRLEDALPRSQPDPGPQTSALGVDGVHAMGTLTRLMPQRRQEVRTSLLASASQAEDDEGAARNASVRVHLPGLGEVAVLPNEALKWAGSLFALGAFFKPGLLVASLRQCILVGVVPWLWKLRLEQQEKDLALRRRERAERDAQAQEEVAPIVPHVVPLVRLSLGVDSEAYDPHQRPPLLYREMVFREGSPMPLGERDVRYTVVGKQSARRYVPPLALDHFGILTRQWQALDSNVSRPDFSVEVEVAVTGMVRYSVLETVKQSLKMYMNVGFTERDLEELQEFFFRHPLHVLVAMQVIGVLQSVLMTLAFKNDITFFRGRASYAGLSSRSMATDTLQELIIFLYLYDFRDISRLILAQWGVSVLISTYKYIKVARLTVVWAYLLPWVVHNRGNAESQQEQNTEDIDARGMRYLKFVMYPLSAAWGLYNLYHYHYKSWWSWLISSLADFAYTFGFINMMPQIFINYKLKSVAHMPWRVLMYKFFNTFIDDVFAFFIMADYMTKKHRYMTLRDDLVFFIFCYQRYIYRVDPNRPDEFGCVYAQPADGTTAAAGELERPQEALLEEEPPTASKPPSSADTADAAPAEDVEAIRLGPGEVAAAPGAGAAEPTAGTSARAAEPEPAAEGASGDGREEEEEQEEEALQELVNEAAAPEEPQPEESEVRRRTGARDSGGEG